MRRMSPDETQGSHEGGSTEAGQADKHEGGGTSSARTCDCEVMAIAWHTKLDRAESRKVAAKARFTRKRTRESNPKLGDASLSGNPEKVK